MHDETKNPLDTSHLRHLAHSPDNMTRSLLLIPALLLLASPLLAQRTPLTLTPIEGARDTVEFHIGSPLFLRLTVNKKGDGCKPFDGKPFYFEAGGAQNGWGFEEIADSSLFPIPSGRCERMIMLGSESSNKVPEGWYTLVVALYFDNRTSVRSDTLVVHAVRSSTGADQVSYACFLMEQIVRHAPLLRDPETLSALFAEGTPKSAESEVLRAMILTGAGEPAAATAALRQSEKLAGGKPVADYATRIRSRLTAATNGR